MEQIIKAVTDVFGISEKELFSSKRTEHLSSARHMVWYLTYPRKTFQHIGDVFGRTHATVLYGVRKIEGEIELLNYRTHTYLSQIKEKLNES